MMTKLLFCAALLLIPRAAMAQVTSLTCVVSEPEVGRGTLFTFDFSESTKSLLFNGQPTKSVVFTEAYIVGFASNGSKYTISRRSGRFSIMNEGPQMLIAGECEIAGKPKF